MKRIFIFFSFLLLVAVGEAQTTTFHFTTPEGFTFYCHIVDAVNKKVEIDKNPDKDLYSTEVPTYIPHVHIPGTVMYGGNSYTVTKINQYGIFFINTDKLTFDDDIDMGFQPIYSGNTGKIKNLYFPKNLTRVPDNFSWSTFSAAVGGGVQTVWFNSKLKRIESFSLWWIKKHMKGFASSQVEEVLTSAFNVSSGDVDIIQDLAVLPQTIRILRDQCFGYSPLPLDKVAIPASMENIGSGVYNISSDVYIKGSNPFTLGTTPFGTQSTLKVHVPVDRSYAFKSAADWASYADKIVEDVQIGATGYTTYYLENENFKVPTGCTAYIITGVTPNNQAIVKVFGAGKIIPKQTGFVLQGPANTTVTYQANVSGTEEDVTGNLLVGTATELQFSSAGHKYYIFAMGGQGPGFYKQGTRGGASIKLKPHRAGLCLDEAIAPAKSFIIDFDAARREAETTGIHGVRPEMQRHDNAVYDLQGRRVTNPTHGIYIMKGRKIIINK